MKASSELTTWRGASFGNARPQGGALFARFKLKTQDLNLGMKNDSPKFLYSLSKVYVNYIFLSPSTICRHLSKLFVFHFYDGIASSRGGSLFLGGERRPSPQYPKYYTADAGCQNHEMMKSGLYYIPQYFSLDADYWRPGALVQVSCDLFRLENKGGGFALNYYHGECPSGCFYFTC